MKFARTGVALVAILVSMVGAACSGSKNGSGFGSDGDGSGSGGDGGSGGNGSGGLGGGGGDGGAGSGPCVPSPLNYDIPGDNCDNDGDGTIDNVTSCDTGLAATGAAADFAKAMGVCQTADATHWGVVSAAYTNGGGGAANDKQHGISTQFGTGGLVPREGKTLGILSTGYGQEWDNSDDKGATADDPNNGAFKGNADESFDGLGGAGSVPSGFPKPGVNAAGTKCDISNSVNDVIDVKLQLKVPANAKGIAFDFDFYSSEWPNFVCSTFNDGFIAYLTSAGFNGGAPDNISFDAKNNPVSVNNAFFDRCTDSVELGCDSCTTGKNCPSQGTSACTGGTTELEGTGFYAPMGAYSKDCSDKSATMSTAGGATGWLTTQAPVNGGETITIEFYIWNTGDGRLDSTVLLDHLTWVPGAVVAGTSRPR